MFLEHVLRCTKNNYMKSLENTSDYLEPTLSMFGNHSVVARCLVCKKYIIPVIIVVITY